MLERLLRALREGVENADVVGVPSERQWTKPETARTFSRTEIQTVFGSAFDYADVMNHNMKISEICLALSRVCRFGGHTKRFYSVAEHLNLVHDLMRHDGASELQLLYGIMHDFGEAVFTDLPSPLKNHLRGEGLIELYEEQEEKFLQQIRHRLNISEPDSDDHLFVKKYDILALEFEIANVMSDSAIGHSILDVKGKKIGVPVLRFDRDMSRYHSIAHRLTKPSDPEKAYHDLLQNFCSLI